ncbi:MAG: group III truncated hemoglobin [Bacteroidota bacterium]
MNKDIEHRNDIILLVDSFYDKVIEDSTIGHIFNDIAKVDWDHHLPVMYSFWGSILLDDATYIGNPMVKHIALSKQYMLTEEHFRVWLRLFQESVDEHFSGLKAEEAKARAATIAQIMRQKVSAVV